MFKWGDRIKVIGLSGSDRRFNGAIGTIKSPPKKWQLGLICQCPHGNKNEFYYSVELDREFQIAGSKSYGKIFAFCGHELEPFKETNLSKPVLTAQDVPDLTKQNNSGIWKGFPKIINFKKEDLKK